MRALLDNSYATQESITPPANGLDKRWTPGIVAESHAYIVNILFYQAFRYAKITPDGVQDVILGQQAVGVIDEKSQHAKSLVADSDGPIAPP
jgi:hypothetical protein